MTTKQLLKRIRTPLPLEDLAELLSQAKKARPLAGTENLVADLKGERLFTSNHEGRAPDNIHKVISRFISRLTPSGKGCFEKKTPPGHRYPWVSICGRGIKASRFVWVLCFGAIPLGKLVCHKCDNTRCCNPEHLFLGTNKDNSDDKFAKGRQSKRRGEAVNTAVLTADVVRQIRRRLARGERRGALAREFGCTRGNIRRIHLNRTWKHV